MEKKYVQMPSLTGNVSCAKSSTKSFVNFVPEKLQHFYSDIL